MDETPGGLPLLPWTLAEATCLDTQHPRSFEQLVALGRQDPGLAVLLLRAANASPDVRAQTCPSVRDAVARLGVLNAYNVLVHRPRVHVVMPTTHPAVVELLDHSVQVAAGMEELARHTRLLGTHWAYALGLLHDVGRYEQVGRHAENQIYASSWRTAGELFTVEADLGLEHHQDRGAELLEAWGLPEFFVQFVKYHHARPERLPARLRASVQLVRWADTLSVGLLRGGALAMERPQWRTPNRLPDLDRLKQRVVAAMRSATERTPWHGSRGGASAS